MEVQVLDSVAAAQSQTVVGRLEVASEPLSVAPGKAIEVRLGPRRSVFVEPGFDAEHLRTQLQVLESAPTVSASAMRAGTEEGAALALAEQ